MDDPFSIGKLFEFLRDRYAEQIENRSTKPCKASKDATDLFVWPCSVLRHLRNEFFTIEKGLFVGRWLNAVSNELINTLERI